MKSYEYFWGYLNSSMRILDTADVQYDHTVNSVQFWGMGIPVSDIVHLCQYLQYSRMNAINKERERQYFGGNKKNDDHGHQWYFCNSGVEYFCLMLFPFMTSVCLSPLASEV